jgi:hypothetical protein
MRESRTSGSMGGPGGRPPTLPDTIVNVYVFSGFWSPFKRQNPCQHIITSSRMPLQLSNVGPGVGSLTDTNC